MLRLCKNLRFAPKKKLTKKLKNLGISQKDIINSVKEMLEKVKSKKEEMNGTPAGDIFQQILDSLGFGDLDLDELENYHISMGYIQMGNKKLRLC